ncbi:hypothetical protein CHS0354_021766 [Potamilus streckersoni]|uniref:EF-hand domain-containing protein n=1 Tax=Potamilus streckersoni TaxID=2493646 RepID=A0AAE0TLE0_9BIVA|nr:hypothetical protein CHS0354_021766 [Potamilus streckersoni]
MSDSKFVEGKTRVWYRMTNKKKNGFMTKKDYADMAQCFIDEFNPGEQKSVKLRAWLIEGWDILIKMGQKATPEHPACFSSENTPKTLLISQTLSKGERITEDLYVQAYQEILRANSDLFKNCLQEMVTIFFSVFDTNGDGFICVEEMIHGLKCFGIDHEKALRKAFVEMDIRKEGKVDKDTYVQAWVDFMMNIDKDKPDVLSRHLTPFLL